MTEGVRVSQADELMDPGVHAPSVYSLVCAIYVCGDWDAGREGKFLADISTTTFYVTRVKWITSEWIDFP